jgi:hypothetical protein
MLISILAACGFVDAPPAWSATAASSPLDAGTVVPDAGCALARGALPGQPAPPRGRLCRVLDAAEPGPAPAGPRLGLSFDCQAVRGRQGGPSALAAAQSGMLTVGDLALLRGDEVTLLPSRDGAPGQLRHDLARCIEHGCAEVSGRQALDAARGLERRGGEVLRADETDLGFLVVVEPGPGLACARVSVFPDVPVRTSGSAGL